MMAKKLKEQQAVRPAVLIAVAAVGVAAVAFFVVNLLMSHSGKGSNTSSSSASVTSPAQNSIPNLDIPTDPPAPPGTGRDPFQPVAGAGATPAPVATAAPVAPAAPAATAKPEFQSTTNSTAYVQVISTAADHKSTEIHDGTILYEQARPGQTLDRGVVVDAINSAGCVALHRGGSRALLCPGSPGVVM